MFFEAKKKKPIKFDYLIMLGFFTILEDVIYAMLMYVWSTTGIFLSPHMSKEKSGKRIHFL